MSAQSKAGQKAQFTTYHKHSSPGKQVHSDANKLMTIHAGKEVVDIGSSDVNALKDELLQLRLIHEPSREILGQYRRSVRETHEREFHLLRDASRKQRALQKSREEAWNLAQLKTWLNGRNSNLTEADMVMSLAKCIQTVESLMLAGSKLDQIRGEFEQWYVKMILTLDRRSGSGDTDGESDIFVQPLSESWHADCTILSRRIEHMDKVLLSSVPIDSASGLGRVVSSHISLVQTLAEEAAIMEAIEDLVLDDERAWAEHSIAKALEGGGDSAAAIAQRQGVWKESR
jgi:hypothetical protein